MFRHVSAPLETTPESVLSGADEPQNGGVRHGQKAHRSRESETRDSLKLRERSGNVYENKGSVWKTCERSGNVIENKGTYACYGSILLKTNDLACAWGRGGGEPHSGSAAFPSSRPKNGRAWETPLGYSSSILSHLIIDNRRTGRPPPHPPAGRGGLSALSIHDPSPCGPKPPSGDGSARKGPARPG